MKGESCWLEMALLLLVASSLSAQTWQWTRDDLVLNPSGLDLREAASWAWGDLDQDGRVDILVRRLGYPADGRLLAYHGMSTSKTPYWVQAQNLLEGFVEPQNSTGVSLADLDGDGLLNLVTRVWQGSFWQFLCWKKNALGKWESESTAFQNLKFDYSLRDSDDPFFADIDSDGDWDMLIGFEPPFRSVGARFFENIGTAQRAAWKEDSTRLEFVYSNPPGYQAWAPILMYVDDDSLLDLVVASVSEGDYDVVFYPGIKDSHGLQWSGKFQFLPLDLDFGIINELLPLDLDHDNRQDLLMLEAGTGRIYLKSGAIGAFFDQDYFRLGPMRFYALSSAIPVDYGKDSQIDLLTIGHFPSFIGNVSSLQAYQKRSLAGMALWRNTHWFSAPTTFGEATDFKAQLADVNNNGLLDFVTSAFPYYFVAFENSDPNFQANWRTRNDLLAPFVNSTSRGDTIYFDPSFADLDGEDDLDLLVTEKYLTATDRGKARYRFFENQLTGDSIIWKLREDWLAGLSEIIYSHSNFVDLDRDGDADLVLGTPEGNLLLYENVGNKMAPVWRLAPSVFDGIDAGDDANPAFGDFNNDGRVDIFVGNRNGEIFFFRNESTSGVAEQSTVPPRFLRLEQNCPNPFFLGRPGVEAGTIIKYEIPQTSHVQLIIYDLLGRIVAVLVDELKAAGRYRVLWHADKVAGGLYFYELTVGESVERKKMILLP